MCSLVVTQPNAFSIRPTPILLTVHTYRVSLCLVSCVPQLCADLYTVKILSPHPQKKILCTWHPFPCLVIVFLCPSWRGLNSSFSVFFLHMIIGTSSFSYFIHSLLLPIAHLHSLPSKGNRFIMVIDICLNVFLLVKCVLLVILFCHVTFSQFSTSNRTVNISFGVSDFHITLHPTADSWLSLFLPTETCTVNISVFPSGPAWGFPVEGRIAPQRQCTRGTEFHPGEPASFLPTPTRLHLLILLIAIYASVMQDWRLSVSQLPNKGQPTHANAVLSVSL